MARVKSVRLICDGCAKELDAETKGVAKATVHIVGSDTVKTLDFCPACAEKLPAGSESKKRGRKAKTETASEPAKA